ncbi:hypothetical protein [Reyranella sp.]|uniref:COG3904 family protein n=1 Tax=Reyranella sp. TaxID=1929291 RepID=UPI003BA8F157
MPRPLVHLIAAGSFAWLAASGQGATLTVETRTIPGLTPQSAMASHTIRLTGLIEGGDASRLRTVLEKLRASPTKPAPGSPLATLELSSKGGDLYEGLKLGYLIREFDVATMVRAHDLCLSACALAFLGGTQSHEAAKAIPSRSLEIGGQVGFHNFYLTSPSDLSANARDGREGVVVGFNAARGGAAAMVRYAAQMGIDPGFVGRVMGLPPDGWEYVDTDEMFVTLRVCPIGLRRLPSNPAAIAASICNHATGGLGRASPLQARSLPIRDARRHLLARVHDTAQAGSAKGPLASQLAAVLASRDEALVDAVYAGLRSAGVPLPEVMSANYEVTGYSVGGVPMECHVSFTRSDPARYDVVLVSPAGLTKPFETAPAACPALFLFERDEVLNPRR